MMKKQVETAPFGNDLVALNEGFLALVMDGAEAGLEARVLARLRKLDVGQRHRLGALPFSLFGFGFEEEAAWAALLSPGVRDLAVGYESCEAEVERFTLLALTALRGFVHAAPRSVSAWIGLPPATRDRLAELEIGLLSPVAALASPRLRARRTLQASVWLRLVDATERDDARQLRLLATLGKQWAIRRSLGIEAAAPASRGFRC